MKQIKVKTPAKINLVLEVVNKREDGFHNIKSIMQTINLFDYLTFDVADDVKTEIILSGNSSEIPYDKTNLVYKAAVKFLELAKIENKKIEIYIEKNIPVSGGLAGGSSNGAGTFFALNKLFNEPLSQLQIEELCASLGSDLNFCLNGGCRFCTSRGEITTPCRSIETPVSLIKPKNMGISAKEAYTKFSNLHDKSIPNNAIKLKETIDAGSFDGSLIYNSLEKPIINDYEELFYIKENLPQSLMSGSGPTFFILDSKVDFLFDKNRYIIIENLKTIPFGVQVCE